MKKSQYQDQAKELGIEFDQETTVKELQDLITKKQSEEEPEKQKTVKVTEPFSIGGFIEIEGQEYKALSGTVLRNTTTGEMFEVILE